MASANLVLVALGTLAVLLGLYYTARTFSSSAKDRAIADARRPLETQNAELKVERADLKIELRDANARIGVLEDELRRRT